MVRVAMEKIETWLDFVGHMQRQRQGNDKDKNPQCDLSTYQQGTVFRYELTK